MLQLADEFDELPLHVQAVFCRQYAREAESFAHKAMDALEAAEALRLAEQWSRLAEQLDEASGLYDCLVSPIPRVSMSGPMTGAR